MTTRGTWVRRQVKSIVARGGGSDRGGCGCWVVSDLKTIEGGVVTGTMDLDAEWVHENGPGAMICSGLTAMCKAHPGVFETVVGGCGGPAKTGCNATAPGAGSATWRSIAHSTAAVQHAAVQHAAV